jgi:hypothetical protein
MRRIGILGLSLAAIFGMTAVATATEELPEIGRCVKLAGAATHKYAGATCTVKSEGENTGKFEWEPGPGPKPGFTSTTELTELETVGKAKLTCGAGSATGQFTGPKTDRVTITFTACEYGAPGGVSCKTPGASAGEVVTNTLEGTLGYISGGGTMKPTVGMRLAPVSGTQFASLECSGTTVTLAGSAIGTITAEINKMTLTSHLKFKQTKGIQSPEAFEGAATSVLTAKSGAEAEQAGLSVIEMNTNEELLEVKATN